ncbi:MAG: hypothetical protein R3246_11130, partial [Acidimicrobiia bacterium]|nr:hypothetical protein [Acidimicrobiia bacterium]
GDVLLVDTDRSLTGQDGQAMSPGAVGHGFPGRLAERLFDLDLGIDHVFVLQNTVTVRRPSGWDEESAGLVTDVTNGFLRHYLEPADLAEEE